jgi:hypothetical protein
MKTLRAFLEFALSPIVLLLEWQEHLMSMEHALSHRHRMIPAEFRGAHLGLLRVFLNGRHN